jgi:hypothetical protein
LTKRVTAAAHFDSLSDDSLREGMVGHTIGHEINRRGNRRKNEISPGLVSLRDNTNLKDPEMSRLQYAFGGKS